MPEMQEPSLEYTEVAANGQTEKENLKKRRERCRRYYQNNRERLLLADRVFYAHNRPKILLRNKVYQQKNKQKIAAWNRKWRAENQEKLIASRKRYRREYAESIAKRRKLSYERNKNRILAQQRDYATRKRVAEKLAVLSVYGGPICVCCGEREIKFLTLDHIDGKGNEHRKKLGDNGRGMYVHLKQLGYPSGFQVLCIACNWAKGQYGSCPHAMLRTPIDLFLSAASKPYLLSADLEAGPSVELPTQGPAVGA